MTDWLGSLTPEEREQWDALVEDFRRTSLEGIVESAAFVSILPPGNQIDPRACMELGAAIMLGKPIIAVALDGQDVPPMLRALAFRVVEGDIDVEDGLKNVGVAITAALDEISEADSGA